MVEACSGLRYLLPLTCISFIVAYLYKAPLLEKGRSCALGHTNNHRSQQLQNCNYRALVNGFGTQMAEGFFMNSRGWSYF